MPVSLKHIDTCMSCYLTDHHNRDSELLYGAYVDGSTTYADIRGELDNGFRSAFDDIPDHVTDDMIKQAIADCFANVTDTSALFDASLEIPDQDSDFDGEPCQAWFLFTWDVA